MSDLIVFPTELAARRHQQALAVRDGFVDTSNHTTLPRLLRLCLAHASVKGERMDPTRRLLVRKQVIEVAAGHFTGRGALGELTPNALGDVLDQLLGELAELPGETSRIIDWLLDHNRNHKLYQLGTLVSVWRAMIKQEGLADRIDINHAVLKCLKGPRENWPPLLRDATSLTYKSVRWFTPFEESCVIALNHKQKVHIESALPGAHAEAAADRLGQKVRSEIMVNPWEAWAEDLGDALAVNSSDLLNLEDAGRVEFSRSAGAYGEMEDLARRIAWHITSKGVLPHRIALIAPGLGAVQDIVPHVFSRFQIPYFFRRGRPTLSSPVVKAFLAWLAFPLRPERDVMIDLVRNPALLFERREDEVERLLKEPPLLKRKPSSLSGSHALALLNKRVVVPEDHFNREALAAVEEILERLGDQLLPLDELLDMVEELLRDATIAPRDSHEQGVWVLNPSDAVGLDFDLVMFAGLNEGEFPATPRQDALLSDTERYWLRKHLEEQGRPLPQMALPAADTQFEKESVMFLAALGMAEKGLVFSRQAVDQEGNEKSESEYFRKLWNLAGWPAMDPIIIGSYDQWRGGQLPAGNLFDRHVIAQQGTAPEDRIPMPGESFLPILPLPLCRAADEALQSATFGGGTTSASSSAESDPIPSSVRHLFKALGIESERATWLETPEEDRAPSVYCGQVPALKTAIAAWLERKEELSPTALEGLARCRYLFFLQHMMGIRDARVPDDAPDPMDRGGLIHDMLREIYSSIASGAVDVPRLWAVKGESGWRIRREEGLDGLPLANFLPEFEEQYLAFAQSIAERRLDQSVLGHAGVWAAERAKVLEQVLNFVRHDARTCAAEHRYPALFELKFADTDAVDLGMVRVRGTIDRVDLIFDEAGDLKRLRVLDYKGPSRARSGSEDYIAEIVQNLDCQLPIYAFAAQRFFFGEFNTEALNAMTEAGYLFYERAFKKVASQAKKSLIPMNEEGLVEGFLATLCNHITCLRNGDFAVDPMLEGFGDYESICRVAARDRELEPTG